MILKYMGPDTESKMVVVPRKAMTVAFYKTNTPAPRRPMRRRRAKKAAAKKSM